MGRDFIVDQNKKNKKCGCPRDCKHTGDCKKFSTDVKKAVLKANTQK